MDAVQHSREAGEKDAEEVTEKEERLTMNGSEMGKNAVQGKTGKVKMCSDLIFDGANLLFKCFK